METERDRYKDAVKNAGSDVASDSVDGESFTYGPRRDWTLEQWGTNIEDALAQLDPENRSFTPSRSIVDLR